MVCKSIYLSAVTAEMYKETLEASKNYDPSIATISEFDLEME